MALFSVSEARSAGRLYRPDSMTKTAGRVLAEDSRTVSLEASFDIFLSHSYYDAQSVSDEVLLGLKSLIEQLGYSVYVDWVVDRQMSRETVSSETAAILRKRMSKSRSLLFVTSDNSSSSKWMPWELGFIDGQKGTAAILPLTTYQSRNSYSGQEYLGIYPYVTHDNDNTGKDRLWVHSDSVTYVNFDSWLSGFKPMTHT